MTTMSEQLAQEHRRNMERAAGARQLRRQVTRSRNRQAERAPVDIDLTAPDASPDGKSLLPHMA